MIQKSSTPRVIAEYHEYVEVIIMNLYSVCQNNVVNVTPDTTVKFVSKLMKEKNIGFVVIAENNKPVGIVTDRDFAIRGGYIRYPIHKGNSCFGLS